MKPSLIIIGLGNPGEQYTMTRHNVGFRVADKLADEFGEGDWQDKQKFKSYILEGRIVTVPILIAKPNTYMNLSGVAARKLIDFYDLDPRKNLLVICDDIDLPIGEVRLREKGGPGTHNGLKSLVDIFGE
ncbi:MAG: aminoacyl-tRNA hydrolase, partial [Patescibacteria group bacterium]